MIIRYIAISMVFIMATTELWANTTNFGFTLPSGLKLIDENRYQSSKTYVDTKKDFHQRLSTSKNIKRIGEEINLPHVRAISYRNTNPKAAFFALNIYLNVQTGITEIFFVVDKE